MKQRKRLQLSLGLKTALTIVAISVLISSVAVVFSYTRYKQALYDLLKTVGVSTATTMAYFVEPESIDYYLMTQETDARYENTLQSLREMAISNKVLYAVIVRPTEEGLIYIYDTDTSENAYRLGDFCSYEDERFENIKDKLLSGETLAVVETETEFGRLLSALVPIKDDAGIVHGYAEVDISMEPITSRLRDYLITIISMLMVATLILATLSIQATQNHFVLPINILAKETSEFVATDRLECKDDIRSIISMPILETGDETEDLYRSIQKMESDIYTYVDDLKFATSEKERISAELSVARTIQMSMLPSSFPETETYDLYATMDPAREVGGDFYDFYELDSSHLALVVADVSGKGVSAALFMAIAMVLLEVGVMNGTDLSSSLEKVNNMLCRNNIAGMFVTAWVGVVDLKTGLVTYVNAGHEKPAIRHAGGQFELFEDRHCFVLGGMEDMTYKVSEFSLQPGDTLFLYTDGVPESIDSDNNQYGTDRMLESLNRHADADLKTLLKGQRKDIDAFVGSAAQFDDITMMGFRLHNLIL